MKKIISAAAVILSAAMVFTGCSENGGSLDREIVAYIENPPEDSAENFFAITYGAWHSEYLYRISSGSYTEEKDAELCKTYRSDIIEYLKQEKVVLYLAEKMGITAASLTDEELKQIDDEMAESLDGWYKSFAPKAGVALGGSGYTEDELLEKEKQLFEEYLSDCGLTVEDLTSWKVNEIIRNKFISKVGEEIDDKTVEDFVQKTVDTAKETYEKDIAEYEKTYTPFYIPEGSRVVQQLVVMIDDISISEVKAYRKEGDDEKADEVLEKALAKVRFRIDEAYEKLEQGTPWKEVQEEYNDESSTNDQDFSLYPKSSSIEEKVIAIGMGIEEKGGYSEIIQTDSGYSIIYYKDDLVFTDEQMNSLIEQGRAFLTDQESYKRVTDFSNDHPYVMNYELLNLDDPDAEETTAANE